MPNHHQFVQSHKSYAQDQIQIAKYMNFLHQWQFIRFYHTHLISITFMLKIGKGPKQDNLKSFICFSSSMLLEFWPCVNLVCEKYNSSLYRTEILYIIPFCSQPFFNVYSPCMTVCNISLFKLCPEDIKYFDFSTGGIFVLLQRLLQG